MPYIHPTEREEMETAIMVLAEHIASPSQLNFAMTRLIVHYLAQHDTNPPNYGTFNEVVGVLECIKLEFYARILTPYEEQKKLKNGDVF